MNHASSTTSPPDFRVLFESAPGLYLVLRPDLTIVAVSDAYLRATMTKRESILGRGLFEVFPDNPDDPSATGEKNLRASLDRVRQKRVPDTMAVQKYDIRRPESEGGGFEERYWSPINSPVLGPGGEVVYIIHRVEDVTAEHAAQQSLQTSHRKLQLALDGAALGMWDWDILTGAVAYDARWCSMLGYQPEELEGHFRTWQRLVHPEDMPQTAKLLEAHFTSEQSLFETEVRMRHKDGSWRWVFTRGQVFARDEAGRPVRAVGTHLDITERKRAEEELHSFNLGLEKLVAKRTAEMRQALATLDATENGAFIFDPETLRFTYANEGAVQQLGYSNHELLAKTPADIAPKFDEAKFRELLGPLLRSQVRSHRFTTVHRHKDGHDIPVEISLQYVAPARERPRFIYIASDITERQRHERLALRSQRLESIGTLAGGIAHDLNNALAPIMLGVELIKMEYPNASETTTMFEISVRRSADMVRHLLNFAKGAEGERVPVHTDRLIQEMENMMKGSFPKNIHLVVKCAKELPTILADATQLHQILLNLCVNARDAMPHGGTLTLEAKFREVDAAYASSVPDAKPGHYVALRVRDTGTGIPAEILDRIFDPFFTTKGPDKGTGLGLSTVVGIVKGHGGFLQVYSQPGQGSTFTAYLPVDRAGHETEFISKTAVAEFRGQGETILLVDDEPGVREMARVVLRRLNFNPLTATDGADGMMQAAQHRTELRAIITDLHMPHMDGLAFIRALRRMLPTLPVLVASGRMEEAVAEEFKSLGVTKRLDKPFTELQLAEALRSLLPGK
jgi:two-component system cell cycle sensor histidine kinase/response regulator CckA